MIGGTGWIAFGVDAPSGSYREIMAILVGTNWSDYRPTVLEKALTRYRLETVTFTFAVDGVPEVRSVRAVISEHFDRETIAHSTAMERSYFAEGYGLIRREAWGRTFEPPVVDLGMRYKWVAYSDSPCEGWHLDNIRTCTNVVSCPLRPVPVMG